MDLLFSGPTKHTVDDIWKMIWQLEINRIVMLTLLSEGGRVNTPCY